MGVKRHRSVRCKGPAWDRVSRSQGAIAACKDNSNRPVLAGAEVKQLLRDGNPRQKKTPAVAGMRPPHPRRMHNLAVGNAHGSEAPGK